jgi:phosphotransferase system  glucose/maltose/N-acetylglucosamine-specific IIC component
VPLYLFIFWFITCKHWWYHIIIVPITLYGFQLFSALSKGSNLIDENESFWVIIVLMCIAPIVYLIRLRLYDRLVLGIDLRKIEAELDEYDRKENETQHNKKIK